MNKFWDIFKISGKSELTFLVIGALMLSTVIFCAVFAIQFLAGTLGRAIANPATSGESGIRFEFEKAETILRK